MPSQQYNTMINETIRRSTPNTIYFNGAPCLHNKLDVLIKLKDLVGHKNKCEF